MLEEQLAEDAAHGPDVDGGPVSLLAQQQLGRPVPQRDDLVGVGPLSVLRRPQPRQTEVAEFHFAPVDNREW